MKYVPALYGLEAELKALKTQNFSNNTCPLLFLVQEKMKLNSPKSLIDEFEKLIISKPDNNFFVSIPQNLDLSSKKPKPHIAEFYNYLLTTPNAYEDILKKFSLNKNVIPTLEASKKIYYSGLLSDLKSSIPSVTNSYAYYVKSTHLDYIKDEIEKIITSQDYIIYDLGTKKLDDKLVSSEIKELLSLKTKLNFTSIVVKQVYKKLTFSKFPDGKILSGTPAYDCIDYSFYNNFKRYGFDYFGDGAGIRDIPIYGGGMSYPSYMTIELDTFEHHGFKGTPFDVTSFEKVVLPKYLKSDHWNRILTPKHKSNCVGCSTIIRFSRKLDKINNAAKWKTVTVSHFLDSMDYKVYNGLI